MAVGQILEGGTMYYGVDLIQNRSTQIQFNLNSKAIIAFIEYSKTSWSIHDGKKSLE
jgi:hypothetical protein